MRTIILLLAITLTMSVSTSFADTASGATGAMSLGTSGTTGAELHAHDTTATSTTALIGKSSTGVGVGWRTSTTGYALITQHKNGSKAMGSSYDSTSLYSEDVTTIGTPVLATPTAIDTTDFNSWNAL